MKHVWALVLLSSSAAAQKPLLKELHRMVSMHSGDARAIATGDVDNDGDADLLLGNFDGATTHFFGLNDGTGAFEDRTGAIPTVPGITEAVAMGDLNGDGFDDAILGKGEDLGFGYLSVPNQLVLGNGLGGFTVPAGALPPIGDYTNSIGLRDLDGDGDLDVLFQNNGAWWGTTWVEDRLLFNNGLGAFVDTTLGGIPSISGRVDLGDVDGDGDNDVLATSGPELWLNNGNATFTESVGAIDGSASKLADVDGDGDLDAVGYGEISVNDGAGVFSAPLPGPSISPTVGDVDGDGDLDLAGVFAASFFGPFTLALFLNDGSGAFADASPNIDLDLVKQLQFVDIDQDDDLDLVVAVDGQSRVLLNDGHGVFVDPDVNPKSSGVPLDIGDVNGDGFADILVGAARIEVHVNDGHGYFAPSLLLDQEEEVRDVVLTDVDGDGDADAILARNWAQNLLFLGDGTGGFSDATAQLPVNEDAQSADVESGDFDGDGDADLLINTAGGDTELDLFWRNDGAGVFTDSSADLPQVEENATDIDIGDFDGDGDLDAVVPLIGSQGADFYVNDGSGHFALGVAPSSHAESACFSDLDVDGDLDIVFGKMDEYPDGQAMNNGSGVFTTKSIGDEHETVAVAAGDMDGDGDVDLLFANYGAPKTYLRASSPGVFVVDASAFAANPYEKTMTVEIADLDGDGDLDAVFGIGGHVGLRVMANMTRHVSWHAAPRLGKPYTIRVSGQSSSPWFLAWGLGEISYPLPPFGTLHLNPAKPLVVHASGVLTTSGQASSTLVAPTDTAFIGAKVYWQALVGNELRFTNLETTTFSGL